MEAAGRCGQMLHTSFLSSTSIDHSSLVAQQISTKLKKCCLAMSIENPKPADVPLHKYLFQTSSDKRAEAAAKFSLNALTLRESNTNHTGSMMSLTELQKADSLFTPILPAPIVRDNGFEQERLRRLAEIRHGAFLGSSKVFRQTVATRSHEVGPDGATSMNYLTSLMQEVAINQMSSMGILGDGIGATHAMNFHRLICVITHLHVEVECYPVWEDVIDVDTWMAVSGKNGMKRDWIIRAHNTGCLMARGTSTLVMMNRDTRKLSKIPDEVRMEMGPMFIERAAFENAQFDRIAKLDEASAHYVCSNLSAKRKDLDMNSHVNNLKYVDWLMEGIPESTLETHETRSFTFEYRRECQKHHVLQSLARLDDHNESTVSSASAVNNDSDLRFTHLIRMQSSEQEILRGQTLWRPKKFNKALPLNVEASR